MIWSCLCGFVFLHTHPLQTPLSRLLAIPGRQPRFLWPLQSLHMSCCSYCLELSFSFPNNSYAPSGSQFGHCWVQEGFASLDLGKGTSFAAPWCLYFPSSHSDTMWSFPDCLSELLCPLGNLGEERCLVCCRVSRPSMVADCNAFLVSD